MSLVGFCGSPTVAGAYGLPSLGKSVGSVLCFRCWIWVMAAFLSPVSMRLGKKFFRSEQPNFEVGLDAQFLFPARKVR